MRRFAALLLGLCCVTAKAAPAVAFYYGDNPPWTELQAFDLVVVEPEHTPDPAAPKLARTQLIAYVSVGEIEPNRPYAKSVPKEWLRGENKDFGSRLVDQSQPDWPRFFNDTVIEPLWKAGYRAFFLDTLDSYQLFAKTQQAQAAQEAGEIALINELKRRHPEAKLIFNRGFEILDRTYKQASMIAAESLFQGYDNGKRTYGAVAQADRDWLLPRMKKAREEYKLDVIAIDYVPPDKRALARETAQKIRQLGFIPWVSQPELESLGVGEVEVMPRKVLIVTSTYPDEYGLRDSDAVRLGTMPLNYLGLAPEYTDVAHLPEKVAPGLYAGVIYWPELRPTAAETRALSRWLAKMRAQGTPFALINYIDAITDSALSNSLGITVGAVTNNNLGGSTVEKQSKMIGFERPPRLDIEGFIPLSIKDGESLLTIAKGRQRQVGAAIMPWGGFVNLPFWTVTLPTNEDERWVTNPFEFFRAALKLPDMPIPDPTTETGRRKLMIHMDGDGFVSRSELPGTPYAGEVIRDRIVRKYPLPMTISIIEAELSPKGLYPKDSPKVEAVARQIFAEPHVQIGTHTYTHPFNWQQAEASGDSPVNSDGEDYNLKIPGYRFSAQREIEGSIRYVESRLAPPGKKVMIVLWPGDCAPGREGLEWTQRMGVANMNGGDTVATLSSNTLTQVEGLGFDKSGIFQVFAPNQNENVYTNEWTGPFYGFERVIETYDLTEKPKRLKPIDIYFHTYIGTKLAAINSLDKIFAYAMKQETTPLHAAEYSHQVQEYRRMVVARTPTGWRIRGTRLGRTLREPVSLGTPDLDAGRNIAGYVRNGDDYYIHLASDDNELILANKPPAQARLVSANAMLESATRAAGRYSWTLNGYVPLQATLANVEGCRVTAGGRDLTPVRKQGDLSFFQISGHAARPLEAICGH